MLQFGRRLRMLRLTVRSKFFLWLDLNLYLDNSSSVEFGQLQTLSLSFTRLIKRDATVLSSSVTWQKPGIHLCGQINNHDHRLNLLTASAIRLAIPRSCALELAVACPGTISITRFRSTKENFQEIDYSNRNLMRHESVPVLGSISGVYGVRLAIVNLLIKRLVSRRRLKFIRQVRT